MNIVLFGAGSVARRLLANELRKENVILGFLDNNQEKWGRKFSLDNVNESKGWMIYPPTELDKLNYDFVIITASNINSPIIKNQLLEMGTPEYKIIMTYDMEEAKYLPSRLDFIFKLDKCSKKEFSRNPAEIYRHYEGETTRCHARREREGFFEKYCKGTGLDVGYGGDVITPTAAGWDLRNGDAQYLAEVEDESFDFVYSSHCIEHMQNVRVALHNWFRVVKPGGYLLLYIPHRDLYEKRKSLPSIFNPDHKHMFLIGKSELPDTLDIVEEITKSLSGFDIKYVKTCDEGYVKNPPKVQSKGEYSIEVVIQKKLEEE